MFSNCTVTQKKGQELFGTPLFSYVFWGAESEFQIKIAPYPISFEHNLKKRYFRVCDGIIMGSKPLSSIMKSDQLYY